MADDRTTITPAVPGVERLLRMRAELQRRLDAEGLL